MAYFTPEDIQQAKQLDLLTYLQIYEPDQLVKVSGDTYCTKNTILSKSATGNGTGSPDKLAAKQPWTIL